MGADGAGERLKIFAMAKEINNVTLEDLEKQFPGEGFKRFREIAEIGGFGVPSLDHTGGVDPAYRGGLDIKGLRDANVSIAKLNKIYELAGGGGEADKADSKKGGTK